MHLIMSDHSRSIDLRSETLEALSASYTGYGGIMEQAGEISIAASCYVIAGMYTAVYDQAVAPVILRQAARLFHQANNSYWKLLSVCGLDTESLLQEEQVFSPGNNPRELYHMLISQYYLLSRGRKNSLPQLIEYISSSPIFLASPVGRSGVPLQTYTSLILAAMNATESRSENALPALGANIQVLFEKNEEQFRLMHAHKIHWNNQIGLIPFEPDLMATLIGLQTHLRGNSVLYALRETSLSSESRMVTAMDIAGEIVQERPYPREERDFR